MVLWKYAPYGEFVLLENELYTSIEDLLSKESSLLDSISSLTVYYNLPLLDIYSYFLPLYQRLNISKDGDCYRLIFYSNFSTYELLYNFNNNTIFHLSNNNDTLKQFLSLWSHYPIIYNLGEMTFTEIY